MADTFAKLGAWARAHRTAVLGAGGAGVAGVAYVMKRRNAGAGGASTANAPSSATPVDPATLDTYGNITPADAFSILLGQQQAFQNAVQGEVSSTGKLGAAQLTGYLAQRDAAGAARRKAVAQWFAHHRAPRPVTPAAPRPAPQRPLPNLAALLAYFRREQNAVRARPGPIVYRPPSSPATPAAVRRFLTPRSTRTAAMPTLTTGTAHAHAPTQRPA